VSKDQGCLGGSSAQKIVALPINDLGTLQVTVRRLTEASFAIALLHRAV
jgi:hypothetical protein